MKINFKKSSAVVISALSILASAPSAFCAPRAIPSGLHYKGNSYNIKVEPIRNIRNLPQSFSSAQALIAASALKTCEKAAKVRPSAGSFFSTEVLTNNEITYESLDHLVEKSYLEAPFATVVGDYGFTNQINVKKIVLPEVSYLGAYAFEYCDSLEEVVFTHKLTHIEPGAFAGCNQNLRIVYEGRVYSISELLSKIKPQVKVSIGRPASYAHYGNGDANTAYYRNSNTSRYYPW